MLWFKKNIILSTLIALFFCTPISISMIALILRPATYLASSGIDGRNAYTLKSENWDYYIGGRAILKYWKDDKKDSTWVYFNKKGDTIKTETYKNDTLIRKKDFK